MDRMLAESGPDGHIVVSTQVVEAGVDINAAVLVTEAAPWPSMVQRAGRCNRTGTVADAELWWFPPAKPDPYDQADVEASVAQLDRLEGQAVTGEDLLACDVAVKDPLEYLDKLRFHRGVSGPGAYGLDQSGRDGLAASS